MRGKKRKSFSPRKKNKAQRERANESHSKDKKTRSTKGDNPSEGGVKGSASSGGRKKFGQRSKVEIQNQEIDQEEADLKNLIWTPV